MNRLSRLLRSLAVFLPAVVLPACGSDAVGPAPEAPPEAPPPAPAIDWAALGPHRIVLGLGFPEGVAGLYRYDGASASVEALSSDLGLDIAVSPDGDWVAYRRYTNLTAVYDVYAARIDGSSERRLSDLAGNSEQGLAWRRDGRLVYTYWEGGACCTHRIAEADPATGGVSQWDPDWPGDWFWSTSSHIDFASDNSAYTTGSVIDGTGSRDALFHRSRDRTDTLLIAGDSEVSYWSPALSPDETLLAFEETLTTVPSGGSRAHVYTRLHVLDLVGGEVTTLLDTGALADGFIGRLDICWTADGTTLVYTLSTGAAREPWAVGAAGGTPRRILGGFEIIALTCLR